MQVFRSIAEFWGGLTPSNAGPDIENDDERETQITELIDQHGFNIRVFLVAASGFFTDSYNLFAPNVISPSLAYIYWREETSGTLETNINIATLSGSILGMLTFGYLADRYGRCRLYGVELVLVIISTLGMAQASRGYSSSTGVSSMSIESWIMFWRFCLGVGIGAEYPLSAVITAEWASTQSRARMMAAVFLMQPLGQLTAYTVGILALIGISRDRGFQPGELNQDKAAPVMDAVWRCVVGVGAIPALVAIGARWTIPETWRFTLIIERNEKQAQEDAESIYAIGGDGIRSSQTVAHHQPQEGNTFEMPEVSRSEENASLRVLERITDVDDTASNPPILTAGGLEVFLRPKEKKKSQFNKRELYEYFISQGHWRYLMGTSLCWLIWDVCYYGLALNNPRTIAKIWQSQTTNMKGTGFSKIPIWNSDPSEPNASIYESLKGDAERAIITICIGATLGSIIILKIINYVPRKTWMAWMFLSLALLFAVMAGSFYRAYQTNLHALTITLYVLCQMLFNLGPNTLIFILPAEIFPTRFRCTCHGIAAASGKLGSLIILLILPRTGVYNLNGDAAPIAKLLGVFAILMALGALICSVWIPEVQDPRSKDCQSDIEVQESRLYNRAGNKRWELRTKSLEELGQGMSMLEKQGQIIGFRRSIARLFSRRSQE